MKQVIHLALLSALALAATGKLIWRPYNGNMPIDAIKSSESIYTTQYYVGRALAAQGNRFGLIPTQVPIGGRQVEIVIDGLLVNITETIEVLCSTTGDDYQWVETSESDLNTTLFGYIPVVGGQESKWDNSDHTFLLIGRMNRTFVGQVYPGRSQINVIINHNAFFNKYFDLLVHKNW